jgi:hypothetical protein
MSFEAAMERLYYAASVHPAASDSQIQTFNWHDSKQTQISGPTFQVIIQNRVGLGLVIAFENAAIPDVLAGNRVNQESRILLASCRSKGSANHLFVERMMRLLGYRKSRFMRAKQ